MNLLDIVVDVLMGDNPPDMDIQSDPAEYENTKPFEIKEAEMIIPDDSDVKMEYINVIERKKDEFPTLFEIFSRGNKPNG